MRIEGDSMMRKQFDLAAALAAAAMLCPLVAGAAALELYVDPTASTNGAGSSWADPFNNLQDAIAAADGDAQLDRIYVREGTLTGGGGAAFVNLNKDNLELLGSYEGVGTPGARTVSPAPATILDAQGLYEQVMVTSGSENVVIDGFVLRGGSATGASPSGAGLSVINARTSFALRNTVIENNSLTATDGNATGAGLYLFYNSADASVIDLTDVVIKDNVLVGGSTVGAPVLRGAGAFLGNTAGASPAVTLTRVTVENNGITADSNTTDGSGGGIWSRWSGALTIEDSTISGNTLNFAGTAAGAYTYNGAGLYLQEGGAITIDNTDVIGNAIDYQGTAAPSATKGGGIFGTLTRNLTITGGSIAGNTIATAATNSENITDGAALSLFENGNTGTVTLSGVRVVGNSGENRAISADSHAVFTLENCVVAGNTTTFRGGAFFSDAVSTVVANCLFDNNRTAERGAAILLNLGASDTADLTNTIFTNNVGTGFASSAIVRLGSTNPVPNVNNCLFDGNTQPAFFQGTNYATGVSLNTLAGSANNLDGDPNFAPVDLITATWTAVSANNGTTTLTDPGAFAQEDLTGVLLQFNTTDPTVASDPFFALILSNDDDSLTVAGDLTGMVSTGDAYALQSIAPKFPSPAIEAGANPGAFAEVPTVDINGVTRPIDGNLDSTASYDIGAVEAAEATTGNVRYVDPDIASPGDGSSWAQALDSIQIAINQAADEADAVQDVVYVKGGTTMGDIGNSTRLLQIGLSNVRIEGGYVGAGSPGPRDLSESGLSILDASVSSSEKVIIVNGEDDVVIDGFVITGGSATTEGAGISSSNPGSLTIANCIIENNTLTTSTGGGAGIYLFKNANSDPVTIDNTIIRNNSITGGAVMYGAGILLNAGGSASPAYTITNSTIEGNLLDPPSSTTEAIGAGAYLTASNSTVILISDSTISGNRVLYDLTTGPDSDSVYQGAGVYLAASSGDIDFTGTDITGNLIVYSGARTTFPFQGEPQGAGVYMAFVDDVTFTGCTLAGNVIESAVAVAGAGEGAAIRGFRNNNLGTISLIDTFVAGNYGHSSPVSFDRYGSLLAQNIVVAGNTAWSSTPALGVHGGITTAAENNQIVQGVFAFNQSNGGLSALNLATDGSDVSNVVNVIFRENATDSNSDGAVGRVSGSGVVELANNLFAGQTTLAFFDGTGFSDAAALDSASVTDLTTTSNIEGSATFAPSLSGTWSAGPSANSDGTRTTLTDTNAFVGEDLAGSLILYNQTDRPTASPAVAYVLSNDDDSITVAADLTAWVSSGDAYEFLDVAPFFPTDAVDNGANSGFSFPANDIDGDSYGVDIAGSGNDGAGSFADIGVQEAQDVAELPVELDSFIVE